MPKRPPPPTTYEDIVRRTVPEPWGGFRPTREEERKAQGFRAISRDEELLRARVHQHLVQAGVAVELLTIDVDDTRVTVGGQVTDPDDLYRVPELVRDVEGVTSVIDRLIVAVAPHVEH